MSTLILALAALLPASASSHREAPAIGLDPAADITDLYAFVSPEDSSKLVILMNVNPLQLPGGGPNFHMFDDNVRYAIHIDNEGDGFEDITFSFRFETTWQYPETFLYNVGDIANPMNLNRIQTYEVARIDDGVVSPLLSGPTAGIVAPSNPGVMSDPTMGYMPESTTPGAITTDHIWAAGQYRFFAGPRQEGFYVDLERTFDLLNLAHADNTNTLLGLNVSTIAIEVPINSVTKDGLAPTAGSNEVIAIWSTTSRRKYRELNDGGADETVYAGKWMQVARLGNPLVNEAVIGVGDKDLFNSVHPSMDGQFLPYVVDPLLMVYMNAILGVPDPGCHSEGLGLGCREDLVLAFLTGHPALGTMPAGYALGGPIPGENGKTFGAFEALRINLTTPNGWPNGRMVGDDVVDTALSAVAGLLFNGAMVPDGVGSAGLYYLNTFPFLGDPWAGDDHPMGHHDL